MALKERLVITAVIVAFVSVRSVCGTKIQCTWGEIPGYCRGDFCINATLPHVNKTLSGCANGSLLSFTDGNTYACEQNLLGKKLCICQKQYCMQELNREQVKYKETKLITCYQCGQSDFTEFCPEEQEKWSQCAGEQCILVKQGDKIVRGCNTETMPIFERRNVNSWIRPSFPSLKPNAVYNEAVLNAETFTCDSHWCNEEVQQPVEESKLKTCQVIADVNGSFGTRELTPGLQCKGQHCFRISVKTDSQWAYVSGCATYAQGVQGGSGQSDTEYKLNDTGCILMDMLVFKAGACFDAELPEDLVPRRIQQLLQKRDSYTVDAQKAADPTDATEEVLIHGLQAEAQRMELKDEEKPGAFDNKHRPLQRPPTPVETGQQNVGAEPAAPAPAAGAEKSDSVTLAGKADHHVVEGLPPNAKEGSGAESSGNTAIVAVFVVIMILIVIAGVVWKFELHKKILQARYQTVAG